jgi:hypothetical protein
MNVEIHIDRLVLDGLDVPFAQRAALQAAIEGELARLVGSGLNQRGADVSSAQPAPRAGGIRSADMGGRDIRAPLWGQLAAGAIPSLRAPEIRAGGTPAQLGNAIAGAVHKAVGGGGR